MAAEAVVPANLLLMAQLVRIARSDAEHATQRAAWEALRKDDG